MPAIKHFSGLATTSTDVYTVPSGKVAKIEGIFYAGSKNTSTCNCFVKIGNFYFSIIDLVTRYRIE